MIYVYFVLQFGMGGEPERTDGLAHFLAHWPSLSNLETECSEGPIIHAEAKYVLSECSGDNSPGLYGLPYKLCSNIPDLFRHLLACVYTN